MTNKTTKFNDEDLEFLRSQAEAASSLLKAISHETRLLILCLLSEREMSVSEIEAIVQLPQANISQQLARLRKDELVATSRDGRTINYRISDKNAKAIVDALYQIYCKPPQ